MIVRFPDQSAAGESLLGQLADRGSDIEDCLTARVYRVGQLPVTGFQIKPLQTLQAGDESRFGLLRIVWELMGITSPGQRPVAQVNIRQVDVPFAGELGDGDLLGSGFQAAFAVWVKPEVRACKACNRGGMSR